MPNLYDIKDDINALGSTLSSFGTYNSYYSDIFVNEKKRSYVCLIKRIDFLKQEISNRIKIAKETEKKNKKNNTEIDNSSKPPPTSQEYYSGLLDSSRKKEYEKNFIKRWYEKIPTILELEKELKIGQETLKAIESWYLPHIQKVEKCIDVNFYFFNLVLKSTGVDWWSEKVADLPDGVDFFKTKYVAELKMYKECLLMDEEEHVDKSRKLQTPSVHDPAVLNVLWDTFIPTSLDMSKTISVLKQLTKDWSTEGALERKKSYTAILEYLDSYYSNLNIGERIKKTVLVPGCGLARLPFEISMQGFTVQGNEYSYHMLLVSNFILNNLYKQGNNDDDDGLVIFPYIHSFSHQKNRDYQTRVIEIPDVYPTQSFKTLREKISTLGINPDVSNNLINGKKIPRFSMTSGSFTDVYANSNEEWDVIVTTFFIDTGINVIEYLDVIYNALKPNGIWINSGPILWHHEKTSNPPKHKNTETKSFDDAIKKFNLEMTMEDLIQAVKNRGFELSPLKVDVNTNLNTNTTNNTNTNTTQTTYCADVHGLSEWIYKTENWVAKKISSS